jgi:hypothetical protein
MKRKVLCIVLALLMCTAAALPTFADAERETPPDRAGITASFGMTNVSGSTYKIWARLVNPTEVMVYAAVGLYDASGNAIAGTSTWSSNILISLNTTATLTSGTYYVRIGYIPIGGTAHAFERVYNI